MLNYIKSEFYRISHTMGLYRFGGIAAALILILHLALYFIGNQYTTSSFSYSNLVANPMVFGYAGAFLAALIYDGNRKNGNLKNTVAFGISRTKIFIGQCIVSLAAAMVLMCVLVGFWILCSTIFLPQEGPVVINDLLWEIPASFFISAACLICGIVCIELFEKSSVAILIWLTVWFFLPKAVFLLSIQFPVLYDMAMWIPENFFSAYQSHINTRECITLWETWEGMLKCILSGMIGIFVFSLSGITLLRKKEL